MKRSPLNFVAAAAIAMFFAACSGSPGNESAKENSNNEERAPWSLSFETVESVDSDCKGENCARAMFVFPILEGGDLNAREKINSDVEVLLSENIKARLPEPMADEAYSDLAKAFIEGYSLFKLEFPDSQAPWYLEIDGKQSSLSEDYFLLRLEVNEFMGGAHPNNYTLLQSYQLTDGALVDVRDLYDEAVLTRNAEKAFRNHHKLEDGASLNDKGFMFADGNFTLPENMAITDGGILLIYNPYEVASYAIGKTEILLTFPLEDI